MVVRNEGSVYSEEVGSVWSEFLGEMTATANSLLNTYTTLSLSGSVPRFKNETEWSALVDELKINALARNEGANDWIKTTFAYPTQIEMTFQTSGATHGNIRVHGIKVLGDNRKGNFFNTIPLSLEAVAQPGYQFSHWEGAVSGTSSKLTSTFTVNSTVKAVFIPIPYTAHQLHINEVQSVNNTTVTDELGGFADWVEIYNKESYAVDLAGYYVSDDTCDLRKWKIKSTQPLKTTVQPGGWLLLWADTDTIQGANHMDLKFDNSEMFVLTYPNGITIADKIVFKLTADQSYGSVSDGSNTDVIFSVPTPGAANNVTTSTDEIANNNFEVYPNPAANQVFLRTASDVKMVDIKVISIDGRLVKQLSQNAVSVPINIGDLESGVYMLLIDDGSAVCTKRMVKM